MFEINLKALSAILVLLLQPDAVPPANAANMILTNASVYTVNDQQPWADAIVIENGVIKFVGSSEQALEYQKPDTQVIDLEEKLVLPGFHDVHMHPLEAYAPPENICILEGGEPITGHLNRIRDCIEEQQENDWFIGWGHWVDDVLDSKTMPKTLLDQLNIGKPAVIFSLTSHSNWVNSAALEAIGWDASSPDPSGGVIIKDEQSGEANGILLDVAADIINELIYAPNEQVLELSYQGLLEAIEEMSANGITSMADARVYRTRKHHELWLKAEREGVLQARTVLDLWVYPQFNDDEQIEALKSLYSNDADRLLRISEIKTYIDGLTSNTTAAMKVPYELDYQIIEGNQGLNYLQEGRLAKYITALEKSGFNFMIHAIGDRGVHEALNAIETAINTNGANIDRRHRITHAELIDDQDLPRFKALGVGADFQLQSDWTFPAQFNSDNRYLIGDRVSLGNRIRSVFDSGANVTLSSDFDVSDMNPLLGIQNAITRGAQSLPTLGDAVKAYTLNGAYALAQEDITGSIEIGKYADLIVLDKNIFELPSNEINSAEVLWTLLAGEEVFRHADW